MLGKPIPWHRKKRWIPKYRRTLPLRLIAGFCSKYLDYYENINYDCLTNGERRILEALSPLPLSCVFDVGANVGKWALMAAGFFPQAAVHCFEVVEETRELLKKNTADQPRVVVNDFGLSDRTGPVEVWMPPEAANRASLIHRPQEPDRVRTLGRVVRGDEYLVENRIGRIDLLKIDTEGADHLVLGGLSQALAAGRVDVIQFEYGRANLTSRFLLRDFYELLRDHGYVVGKIYPGYTDFREFKVSHEDFRGPNFLAVRNDRPDLISLTA